MTAADDPLDGGAPLANETPAADTGDELEQLLAEFDGAGSAGPADNDAPDAAAPAPAAAAPPSDGTPQRQNQLEARVNEIQSQLAMEAAQRDFNAAMYAIRGDADPGLFSDEFTKTWIDNQARRDLAVTQAWLNRKADPQSYRRAVEKLGKKFHNEVVRQRPDRQATEDHAAVTAAVRNAGGTAPPSPPPNYSNMTNDEFRAAHKRDFGYYPNV